ncbi:HEPN domain-containing protein [bacterium]|nr:HEPN domain-containing protein [bacterium]
MPDKKDVEKVVRQWKKKAEHDLKVAEHTLEIQRDCPTEIVCFHSQQCVEKYLKAYLISINKPFPKTHDIEQLLLLFPKQMSFNISSEEKARLTEYATIARYPGDIEPIDVAEAEKAVRLAKRIRRLVKKLK